MTSVPPAPRGALLALTRGVSPAITRCELTHLARDPIDVELAVRQHSAYEAALVSLGCRVERVPADPELADAVFIEDTAVVLDEVAIIARPGARSRRREPEEVARVLAAYRPLAWIEPPATLDGGDVVLAGRTLFVGLSSRTNLEATTQLRRALAPHGYQLLPVVVRGCLHLKSAVTALTDDTVLLNPEWVEQAELPRLRTIAVDPAEPGAANVVRVGAGLIHSAGFPRTRGRIEACGLRVLPVELTELAKAEGAATCCSLVFRA
jgi:dimethylargininase